MAEEETAREAGSRRVAAGRPCQIVLEPAAAAEPLASPTMETSCFRRRRVEVEEEAVSRFSSRGRLSGAEEAVVEVRVTPRIATPSSWFVRPSESRR